MTFEVPTDLIRQVQISLRNDAGLSDYDPDDQTLPSLPSLEASIAGFDPSPPYLRCRHCQGRLLRGLQSVICIYCGKQHNNDLVPDPISFKSTFGYRWLLESLDLDGSEIMGPLTEGSELNRGHIKTQDAISLSDLLDLKITWPVEPDKPTTSSNEIVTSKAGEESSLNLSGVDIGNFFLGSKSDIVTTLEDEVKDTTTAFAGQDNLSLFQNAQPPEITSRPSEDETGGTSFKWDANFQSADYVVGNPHENSKPFDGPPTNSAVDLSAHTYSVFGINPDKPSNSSSMSGDWFQDDRWDSTSIRSEPENGVEHEDDSFDDWNEFTSSAGAHDSSGNAREQSRSQANEGVQENLFSSTTDFQDMDFGTFSQSDLFTGSSSSQNGPEKVNNVLSDGFASERISDSKSKVGGDLGQAPKDTDVSNVTAQPKDEAEILMSQMHDLSFMLDTDVSVPSNGRQS